MYFISIQLQRQSYSCSYYKRFIMNVSTVMSSITRELQSKLPKHLRVGICISSGSDALELPTTCARSTYITTHTTNTLNTTQHGLKTHLPHHHPNESPLQHLRPTSPHKTTPTTPHPQSQCHSTSSSSNNTSHPPRLHDNLPSPPKQKETRPPRRSPGAEMERGDHRAHDPARQPRDQHPR